MAIWGKRDSEPADGDAVVMDAETAVKDPAPTGAARDPAETTGAAREPAGTARKPAETASGPAATEGLHDPEATQAPGQPAVTQEPLAAAASPDVPGSISPQRWSEILAAFVDDPRGSVKMAADTVDSAIEEVVASVRAQQRDLASSWQGSETDTEQLRLAMHEYRRLGAQVRQMSSARPSGRKTGTAS